LRIRPSLSLKISLLAFLNVSLLVLVFFLFARFQFRFDLDSFLFAPARDRILSASRLLALEFAEEPIGKWNDALLRHAKSSSAQIYLFADDGRRLAGPFIELPESVRSSLTRGHHTRWYVGRDTHIHLKVHVGGEIENRKYARGHVSHTGQLFFPDELSDEISNLKPYVDRKNVARTRLDEDMVVADAHGSPVMLSFEQIKRDSLEGGLIGTAFVRVDPTANLHEDRRRPFPRGGPSKSTF
jgi:hypothetical protein